MKRPIEADYASHVAYTRALEEYCDLLVKSEQKPTVLIQTHREGFWCDDLTCKKCYGADFRFKHAPPQRTWVGLTDAESQLIYDMGRTPSGMMEMVESKLKEKNTWPTK